MSSEKIVNNTIHSVKIILYKRQKDAIQYLILKEPEGIYGFVGGAQDIDDVSITQTAIREIFEEIQLTQKSYVLTDCNFFQNFIHTDKQSPRYGKKGVQHAFLGEYNGAEDIQLCDELLSYQWALKETVFEKIKTSYPYLKTIFEKATASLR